MSKIAFIYPGQGAQAVGMGKDFYEKSPLSRTIFDQASEAVNLDLKKLCFEENDLLDKTENKVQYPYCSESVFSLPLPAQIECSLQPVIAGDLRSAPEKQ